jgi:hypothetical protein
VLEQIYGSSNSKKLSSSASENISSFTHCDQDQEEQSSVQKELNSASLRKSEGPILTEQKKTCLKKMIAQPQVLTLMMMTQMMNMMNKNS